MAPWLFWNREIVGFGPSRVREFGEAAGHAERVAIARRSAPTRTRTACGLRDVFDVAAMRCLPTRGRAQAKLSRMYHEHDAADGGKPI